MGTKFKSAAERVSVFEEDFEGVCEVLAGPSRWKEFISPNIAPAIKKFPGRSFRIVSAEEFGRYALEPDDMGFTDKIKGEVVFKEIFKDSAATVMNSALHEMVHWVSHPAEQGKQVTVMIFLGRGLMEGLTQVVTEDIVQDQGIAPYSKAVYTERVAIVRKLMEQIPLRAFGEALFQGHVQKLQPALDLYGPAAWQQIKTYATMNNSQKAIECIDNLNRARDGKKTRSAGGR